MNRLELFKRAPLAIVAVAALPIIGEAKPKGDALPAAHYENCVFEEGVTIVGNGTTITNCTIRASKGAAVTFEADTYRENIVRWMSPRKAKA